MKFYEDDEHAELTIAHKFKFRFNKLGDKFTMEVDRDYLQAAQDTLDELFPRIRDE